MAFDHSPEGGWESALASRFRGAVHPSSSYTHWASSALCARGAQLSAHRTKPWPRPSDSGRVVEHEVTEQWRRWSPCGVPCTLGLTNPLYIPAAFGNSRMSFNSRLSSTRLAI